MGPKSRRVAEGSTSTASSSTEKRPKEKKGNFTKLNVIMVIGIALFSCLVVPLLINAFKLNTFLKKTGTEEQSARRPDVAKDLKFVLLASLACGLVQYIIEKSTYNLWYTICKEKKNEKIRVKKALKSSTLSFKGPFYTLLVAYEIYYFSDAPWWPTFLGGKCAPNDLMENLFIGNPHVENPTPYMREFYLLQMGYRLGDLFNQILKSDHANDHFEMLLHHLVALVLVVTAYVAGIEPIGALIMVYHDIPDAIIPGMRILADSVFVNYKVLGEIVGIWYVLVYFSWIAFRLTALPHLVYSLWIWGNIGGSEFEHHEVMTKVCCGYLGVLCFLHWVWFYPLTMILINMFKGVREDL